MQALKYILLFCILMLTVVNSYSQPLQSNYSYWEHDIWDEESGKKIPSKCDCDYIQQTLTLEVDSTFELTIQEGRMDPEFSHIKGNWRIYNDSILLVSGQYTDGIFANTLYSFSFIIRNHLLSDNKTIQYYEIFDGYRPWRGSGDVLSQKTKK